MESIAAGDVEDETAVDIRSPENNPQNCRRHETLGENYIALFLCCARFALIDSAFPLVHVSELLDDQEVTHAADRYYCRETYSVNRVLDPIGNRSFRVNFL